MQSKVTDYAAPMIDLDHLMIKYRKAVLKHEYKEAFAISLKMHQCVSDITDYTFGVLNEIKSR